MKNDFMTKLLFIKNITMWEKNLWFRIVHNLFETEENKEKVKELKKSENIIYAWKDQFMSMINQMDSLRDATESPDQKRLCSIAISKLEEACMFCVKAATYDK